MEPKIEFKIEARQKISSNGLFFAECDLIKELWTANQKGLVTRFNDHVKVKGTYERNIRTV